MNLGLIYVPTGAYFLLFMLGFFMLYLSDSFSDPKALDFSNNFNFDLDTYDFSGPFNGISSYLNLKGYSGIRGYKLELWF